MAVDAATRRLYWLSLLRAAEAEAEAETCPSVFCGEPAAPAVLLSASRGLPTLWGYTRLTSDGSAAFIATQTGGSKPNVSQIYSTELTRQPGPQHRCGQPTVTLRRLT
jgi:hypothetical protein